MTRRVKAPENRSAARAVALATEPGRPFAGDPPAALEVLDMLGILGERNRRGRWTVSDVPLGPHTEMVQANPGRRGGL